MGDEMNTLEMRLPTLVYGSTYLNVPGGTLPQHNTKLVKLVEEIGQTYGVISGSNLKKGIHHISQNVSGVSKRQIKMMLRNVPVAIIHNPNEDEYIYRCSIKYYSKVLEYIIKISNNLTPPYSDTLIPEVKRGINFVSAFSKKESIRTIANNILREIDIIDRM